MLARLAGGICCGLQSPDYPTRLGIVRNLAAQQGLALPDDVAEYIAAQFTTQARELAGRLSGWRPRAWPMGVRSL